MEDSSVLFWYYEETIMLLRHFYVILLHIFYTLSDAQGKLCVKLAYCSPCWIAELFLLGECMALWGKPNEPSIPYDRKF